MSAPTVDDLLARARSSVAEKRARSVYSDDLLAALAEPLELRPPAEVAAGPAWPEALRTAEVTVGPPPPSNRQAVGAVLSAVKRAVERALRWYLPPVAAQVTRHNRAVLEVLAEHSRHIIELRHEIDALRRRVAALEAESRDRRA